MEANSIIHFIKNYRRIQQLLEGGFFVFGLLIAFFASWLIGWALSFLIPNNSSTYFINQYLWLVLFFLGFLFLLVMKRQSLWDLLRFKPLLYSAKEVEQKQPMNGELISAVDFIENEDKQTSQVSQSLKQIFIKQYASKIKNISPASLHNFRTLRYLTLMLLALLLLFSLGFTQTNNPLAFALRSFVPNVPQANPIHFMERLYFHHLQYPDQLLRGQDFTCSFDTNAIHKSIRFYHRESPQELSMEEIQNQSVLSESFNREFHREEIIGNSFTLSNVDEHFVFQIHYSNDFEQKTTEYYFVPVYIKPAIESIHLYYNYPDSYEIANREVVDNGNIEALSGTWITFSLDCNNPLQTAHLIINYNSIYEEGITAQEAIADNLIPLTIEQEDDTKAQVSFVLRSHRNRNYIGYRSSGGSYLQRQLILPEYSILFTDHHGYSSEGNISYRITILPDNPPELYIVSPEKEIESENTVYQMVNLYAADDYFITGIWSEVYKEKYPEEITQAAYPITKSAQIRENFELDLTSLYVNPGDIVQYRFITKDNIGQQAVSQWYSITFPDLLSLFRHFREEESRMEDALTNLQQQQNRIKEEMEEVAQQIAHQPTPSQAAMRQMEQLVQQQEELIEDIEALSEDLSEMAEELREQDSVPAQQLAEKYEEIDRLLSELLSEEAWDDLQRLRQMMEQMAQQSNQQYDPEELDFESYLDRLNKTLEQLRRIKDYHQVLEGLEMLDQAEELQEQLNEQIADNPSIPEEEREAMEQNQENRDELLRQIEERLQAIQDENFQEQAQEIAQQIREGDLNQALENFDSSTDQNQCQQASQAGEQAVEEMENVEEQMQELAEQMEGFNMAEIKAYLNETIGALTVLLTEHGENTELLEHGINSPGSLTEAQYSFLIEQGVFAKQSLNYRSREFNRIFEGVLENKETFLTMFNSLSTSIQNFGNYIADRTLHYARLEQHTFLRGLSRLILYLIKLENQLNQMQANSSSGGGASSMQDLANAQEQLNQQVQSMMGQVGQQQLSPEQIEYMRQLGRQQGQLAQGVREYQQEAEERGQSTMGDLEALADEMEQVGLAMEEQELNQQLVDRQAEILEKMLEYSKALSQRGESEEREAETQREEMISTDDQAELRRILDQLLESQSRGQWQQNHTLSDYQIHLLKDYFQRLRQYQQN